MTPKIAVFGDPGSLSGNPATIFFSETNIWWPWTLQPFSANQKIPLPCKSLALTAHNVSWANNKCRNTNFQRILNCDESFWKKQCAWKPTAAFSSVVNHHFRHQVFSVQTYTPVGVFISVSSMTAGLQIPIHCQTWTMTWFCGTLVCFFLQCQVCLICNSVKEATNKVFFWNVAHPEQFSPKT